MKHLKTLPVKGSDTAELFGTEKIGKILFKIAPPVMLAQLILALYNVVDSYFVGHYSDDGLTALSVIYPIQLCITALAVGTGVGVNTFMARRYAQNENDEADRTAGTGLVLALVSWAVFAVLAVCIMKPFVKLCTSSPQVIKDAVTYGNIVSVGSIGVFLEGCFTKVHQASGNMKLPTIAQVVGALTNIVLDPLFIFGFGCIPKMGVAGAAIATVIGQIAAAVITGVRGARRPPQFKKLGAYIRPIYFYGFPSIFMQMLYVVYIMLLNVILSGFSDAAVTVLGLYYKWQSFFFIPLFALQTCIVPVLSYNYSRQSYDRCREIVRDSVWFSLALMAVGIFSFEVIPDVLIKIFSQSEEVLEIGKIGFRIIGASFAPAVFSLISPTIFQAIGKAGQSLFLSLFRQVICLVPIFWLFSFVGLNYTWLSFPISETLTTVIGLIWYYRDFVKRFPNEKIVS